MAELKPREQVLATLVRLIAEKPPSAAEGLRRVLVVLLILFTAFCSFSLWRHPQWITNLGPVPIPERSIEDRIADDPKMEALLVEELENFSAQYQPFGLILVSWEELRSMNGLWVDPKSNFPFTTGPHVPPPELRSLGGYFVFEECSTIQSSVFESKKKVACPIFTEHDVWGYVAILVDKGENYARLERALGALASRLTEIIYG